MTGELKPGELKAGLKAEELKSGELKPRKETMPAGMAAGGQVIERGLARLKAGFEVVKSFLSIRHQRVGLLVLRRFENRCIDVPFRDLA
jgi:hypothetical protein